MVYQLFYLLSGIPLKRKRKSSRNGDVEHMNGDVEHMNGDVDCARSDTDHDFSDQDDHPE